MEYEGDRGWWRATGVGLRIVRPICKPIGSSDLFMQEFLKSEIGIPIERNFPAGLS